MVLPFLSQAGTTAANAADMPAVGADTQQANSLAELTRLLGGDLSASLTGGDKLLALSALMRSATRSGRRAGLTPQQVMGQLQQQKVSELQNRLTIEQMRSKMAQEQRQEQAMAQFVSTLPEELQARFPALDAEGKQAVLREYATPQPFQIVKSGGESFMTFRNKDIPPVKLDIPRDVETTEIDTGATIKIVDKITREVIQEYPKEMSPYQAGMLGLAQSRERRLATQPPSGGTTGKQTQLRTYKTPSGEVVSGEVRWDRSKDSWVDRAGNKVTLMPSPTSATDVQVPPELRERRFQQQ